MNDTESTCEVVKVVSVEKHPNADRLEIAKFAFASGVNPDYQVVTGRGDFVVGDLAVYVSDDMLVPVSRPEFEFLKDKAKGGYHRVRACRLRGVMSTGFLIRNNDLVKQNATSEEVYFKIGNLGVDVSAKLGVLKYVNPLDVENSTGGQNTGMGKKRGRLLSKLLSWFGKKLYSPPKIPDYSVLSLRKVPDLFEEGEPVILTEKIHGSNIRFGRVNGRVYIGSHHTEKSDSRPWLLRILTGTKRKGSGYYGTDVWSTWFRRVFNTKDRLNKLPNNVVFYGEIFGPGIQPWTYGLRNTEVMVFDAYQLPVKKSWWQFWKKADSGGWLNRNELLSELPLFVKTVPEVDAGPFVKQFVKQFAEMPNSVKQCFDTDPKHKCNDREGIVVRSLDWKKAGKLVSDKYLASEH